MTYTITYTDKNGDDQTIVKTASADSSEYTTIPDVEVGTDITLYLTDGTSSDVWMVGSSQVTGRGKKATFTLNPTDRTEPVTLSLSNEYNEYAGANVNYMTFNSNANMSYDKITVSN